MTELTDVELVVCVRNTKTSPMERERIAGMVQEMLTQSLKPYDMTCDVSVTGGSTEFVYTEEERAYAKMNAQEKLKIRLQEFEPPIHPEIGNLVLEGWIHFYEAAWLADHVPIQDQPQYAADMKRLNRRTFMMLVKGDTQL